MSTSKDWVSQPNGFNRPKVVSKKMVQSYNQGSSLGDPDVAKALESKMQEPDNRFGANYTMEDMVNALPGNHTEHTANRIVGQIKDAESILRQLPDVSLAANIVVSAIVKGGLQTTAITIDSDLEKTLGAITTPLCQSISDFLEEEFALKKNLSRWVNKSLVVEGAVPFLILPETTIDKSVNSDLAVGLEAYHKAYIETYKTSYGALGAGDPKLLENLDEELNPSVDGGLNHEYYAKTADYNRLYQRFLDNPASLKVSLLRKRNVQDRFAELYLAHTNCYNGYLIGGNNADESKDNQPDAFTAAIRDQKSGKVTLKSSYANSGNRAYTHRPVEQLRDPSTLERPNIGMAGKMILPMECVSPIFDPSDPTVHVAYLIALDENHRPVSRTSGTTKLTDEYNTMANSGSLSSMFVRQVDQGMNIDANPTGSGERQKNQYLDYQQALELYTAVTWNDWKTRIENGVLGTSYHVGKPGDLMRLLFEMSLRKKRVQMLLVPASLMVYWAYNYDEVGVGESLIEMTKTIASLRLVLMYSQVNMEFQASIPRRRLDIKIDPREPDQKAAVRMIYNNLLLNSQNQMPVNVIDPVSINQSVWRQAVEVNVESDPRYPQTKVEVSPIQYDKREPDAALTERLQKLHNMGFTLTPEQIDTSLGDERVTSRLLNNELFRERISMWKDITDYHLTDVTRKFCLNSQPIMEMVHKAIESNKDTIAKAVDGANRSVDVGRLAHNFIMGLTATLPALEEEGTDDTETKFKAYDEFLETVLTSQFSEEIFQSGAENVRIEDIKLLRSLLKADLVRQWLIRRGVVPEIGNWVGVNGASNIKMTIERSMDWLKSISPSITSVVRELRAINDSMGDEVPARGGEVAQENGNADGGGTPEMDGGFEDDFDFEDESEPDLDEPSEDDTADTTDDATPPEENKEGEEKE